MPSDVVVTIPGLLSREECAAEIDRAEGLGFGEAPITTERGFVRAPEVRNNTRVMRDDPRQASLIWSRLCSHTPPTLPGWSAVGLNERFRLYRYTPGQYFRTHRDGCFARSSSEQSQLTLLIYLNEEFTGGETLLLDWGRVRPQTGLALIFSHRMLHESVALRSGRKYVLRSDVMYSRRESESIAASAVTKQ